MTQWHPELTLEVGFGSTHQTSSPTWTDVTAYSFASDGWNIRRNRQRQLDKIESGTLAFTLRDDDGRFNPWNTAGAYYGNIKVGMPVRASAVYASTTYRLFYGFVESWRIVPDKERARVDVVCKDALGILQPWTITASHGSQLTSARVTAILDAISWPAGLRSLDTGLTTMLADSPADESVLSLLQAVMDAEFGVLYHAPNGNITFHNRHHRSTAPYNALQAVFGGAGLFEIGSAILGTDTVLDGGLPYRELDDLPLDDTNVYNQVTCTREGGVAQVASNSTSQATYGKRSLSRTNLQMSTDAEALSQASWILFRSKDAEVEVDTLHLKGRDNALLWEQMLEREIGDRVRIIRELEGDDFDSTVIIESISHTIRDKGSDWVVSLRCSPARFWSFWLVGYNYLGLDTVVGY